MNNGDGSFWMAGLQTEYGKRPQAPSGIEADVLIVGGGLSGLWTAFWLTQLCPEKTIAVLEKEHVGFGASGRSGGWLSGKRVGMREPFLRAGYSPSHLLQAEERLFDAIDEILSVFSQHGESVGALKSGWMQIARSKSELQRLKKLVASEREWGIAPNDLEFLSADESLERVKAENLTGSIYSPHAAVVDPYELTTALARVCESYGVKIFENSGVSDVRGGTCTGVFGTARAGTVVLATEGYTAALPRRKRELLPMLSSMIVTERLSDKAWEQIGWLGRECVGGAQHMYFYAQATKDGRIALGGRGKPYNWASKTDADGQVGEATVNQLAATLGGLFPNVQFPLSHAWCGVLGVTRDWSPFIDTSESGSLIQMGGYAGQGLTASYIAGELVAQMITGGASDNRHRHWMRQLPRKWEVEPFRYLGANLVYKLYRLGDRVEQARNGDSTSVFARAGHLLAGRS